MGHANQLREQGAPFPPSLVCNFRFLLSSVFRFGSITPACILYLLHTFLQVTESAAASHSTVMMKKLELLKTMNLLLLLMA